MDYQTEQELIKVWRALRCKANCNLSGLTFDSGLTRTGNNVQLGGALLQDTVISFAPSEYYFGIGESVGSAFGRFFSFGDILNDGRIKALFLNVDDFNATSRSFAYPNLIYSIIASTDAQNVSATIRDEGTGDDYGLFVFDNEGQKTANIYYGIAGGGGVFTDISRIEANKYKVHARHIIDPTGIVGNYNGTEASDTYSQLEYNKVVEDGQASGTCWTIDIDGASLFVGGVKQFRIKNSVPSYADDAAAGVGGLTTGDVYKTTTGGSTFLKIVP